MTETNSNLPDTDPSQHLTYCAPSRKSASARELSTIYGSVHNDARSLRDSRVKLPKPDSCRREDRLSLDSQRQLCIDLKSTALSLQTTLKSIAEQTEVSPHRRGECHSRVHMAHRLRQRISASNVPQALKDAFKPIDENREDTFAAFFQSLVGSPEAGTVCSKKALMYFEPLEGVKLVGELSRNIEESLPILLESPWCTPECVTVASTEDGSAVSRESQTRHGSEQSTLGVELPISAVSKPSRWEKLLSKGGSRTG